MSTTKHEIRNSGHRVLIVGCGDIGSRHLQAVACAPLVSEIQVVDSRPEALELGKRRLAEMSGHQVTARVRWFSSLEEASVGGDLCILATQAEGRCQLVRDVTQTLEYPSFILEKLAAQSVGQLDGHVQPQERRC